MRTVELNIYKFNELPKVVQRQIITRYLSSTMSFCDLDEKKAKDYLKHNAEYFVNGTMFNSLNLEKPEIVAAVIR